MLNRKTSNPNPSQSYPETVVSAGMRIEGELKSNGSIKIDGVISGKVHTSQDLEIGPNAQIDADLIAQRATIAGVVKGNITVKNQVTILETGKGDRQHQLFYYWDQGGSLFQRRLQDAGTKTCNRQKPGGRARRRQ
jgi:cytoskeletal protein CcmA (bactofilin family)